MSQQGLPNLSNQSQQPGISQEKPRSDIYTALLMIALAAILAAIGLLCNEMSKYDWDWKAKNVKQPPQSRLELPQAAPLAAAETSLHTRFDPLESRL